MSPRVMVAEDEADMLFLIARRIENLGHEVTRAGDGDEAMRLILRNSFDLVVTDINMPGATGLDLLAELKSRDPYCQVIIVTANATMENAIEALNRGAFSYLTKPFDHISVISNSVERALEYRQLQLDNMRMAEAQRRRGDMLEDEVTDRVRQYGRQEQAYRQLLAKLPTGIIVASSNGHYLPRNPAAERWLARDEQSSDHPIRSFLDHLSTLDGHDGEARIRLAGREVRLRASKMTADGPVVERLVMIDDMSQISQGLGQELAPVVAQMSHDLNMFDLDQISDPEIFLDIARQVHRLELLCLSLGVDPNS
ncbi:MAG TPA: response regulator [Anaerolineales bacterium]|jgi:CheY-like chemotaxis protein